MWVSLIIFIFKIMVLIANLLDILMIKWENIALTEI